MWLLSGLIAHGYAREHFKGQFSHRLSSVSKDRRMLLTGNDALALGAVAAGCKFMAGYPMTPVTSIMEYLAPKAKDLDLIVVQPEDEIAAINMVIGAGYAGVRAMTATSGGGFCLMVEGLSLAGMTETPIVVVLGQRPGPAIGLPTRTEQGELEFALHAGHGEFPRVIFAPGTIEDCIELTRRAFNLADKYQIPVFILSDQYIIDTYYNFVAPDLAAHNIEHQFVKTDKDYSRYAITESGVSLRGIPGYGEGLVVLDSDEHDIRGHITEDYDVRTAMVNKRLRKMDLIVQEAIPPELTGSRECEYLVVCWGSTYHIAREAIQKLGRADIKTPAPLPNFLQSPVGPREPHQRLKEAFRGPPDLRQRLVFRHLQKSAGIDDDGIGGGR
jgi:2-oxoglutarate ferredoxin oxidoreductase subunit alpha